MDSNKNSIYVELPSNGSAEIYPDNRIGDYKNIISPDLVLDGRWQLGLAEIMYPRTWSVLKNSGRFLIFLHRPDNLGKYKFTINQLIAGQKIAVVEVETPLTGVVSAPYPVSVSKTEIQSIDRLTINFPKGNYSTHKMLIEYTVMAINRAYDDVSPIKRDDGTNILKLAEGFANPITGILYFKLAIPDFNILFFREDDVSLLLGYEKPTEQIGQHLFEEYYFSADKPPSLPATQTLYVQSDIVEQQHVGNKLIPLLRAVPVTGNHGENVMTTFEKPYYRHVTKGYLNSIQIRIYDDNGKEVDFDSGKVRCTLHFRRVAV